MKLFFIFCCTLFVVSADAYEECGTLNNGYGPYDYWTDKDKLGIVETRHFTPQVEMLRAGESSYIGDDLEYTLRAFPNHPRALMAMVKLGEKEKTNRPKGTKLPVHCFLDRAIRFRPEDGSARMIAAMYFAKSGQHKKALEHLEIAEEKSGDNANLHYNIGLAYFELQRYKEALEHAHIAYRLGFPLPGLRRKLESAGKWYAPEPTSSSETTSKATADTE